MKNNVLPKIVLWLVIIVSVMAVVNIADNEIKKKMYPKTYSCEVEKYSYEYGVPEYIVYSVIYVESGFDKNAVSKSGACGLMQLMPDTYAWLADISGEKTKDIFAPDENIKYGTYYLSVLFDKYNDWEKTFASYNAGPGNVDMWLKEEEYNIKFEETKNYVDKLRVITQKYKEIYY